MSESLKDEIAKISKETRDTQDRINVIVSIFTKENVDYHSRESAERWHRIPLYDEMTYLERKLGLTQQRFASLMLQSVKGSTDQLDSSVRTLHSSTEILIKSSKRLEYLTYSFSSRRSVWLCHLRPQSFRRICCCRFQFYR